MATGGVKVSDIIVPEIFEAYASVDTEAKSRLIQSGAVARSSKLDELLAGGGLTFNIPGYGDIDDADVVATDDIADKILLSESGASPALPSSFNDITPNDIATHTEVGVRLLRNGAWSEQKLAGILSGSDPLRRIAERVAAWRRRRLQDIMIATLKGVNADNSANDSADYAHDVTGASFIDGTTNFTAANFLDAQVLLGDSLDDLSLIMVHSTVYNTMRKNDLIDFEADSVQGRVIKRFMGMEVIVDDSMPSGTSALQGDGTAGVSGMFESWIFGPGAIQLGVGSPGMPVEVGREPAAGQGSGQDVLYVRNMWCLHPTGHAYTGTAPNGGPSNLATSNNLAAAGSWNRVYPERKQIKYVRLVTRES